MVSFVNWMLLSKTVTELTSFSQYKATRFPREDPKGAPGERVASTSATGLTNPSLCLHSSASQDTNTLPAHLPSEMPASMRQHSLLEIVFTHLNPIRFEELALESHWTSRNHLQKANTFAFGGFWTARNSGRENEIQATATTTIGEQAVGGNAQRIFHSKLRAHTRQTL